MFLFYNSTVNKDSCILYLVFYGSRFTMLFLLDGPDYAQVVEDSEAMHDCGTTKCENYAKCENC